MSAPNDRWMERSDEATRRIILRELEELRAQDDGRLWADLEIINHYDPMNLLRHGMPPTEYRPEVMSIYPRLEQARSSQDVCQIVEEEFKRSFGTGGGSGGERWVDESYRIRMADSDVDAMSAEIWRRWEAMRSTES